MLKHAFTLAADARVELWARSRGQARAAASLRIMLNGSKIFAIDPPAGRCTCFSHRQDEAADVVLEWDPAAIKIPFGYSYDPATVARSGITAWSFAPDGVSMLTGSELAASLHADWLRPALHYSPVAGWINDPNGLCFANGRWHMFCQFHPGSQAWGPMHWAHASSSDLHHWTHLPVFLHPSREVARRGAAGGAFSGSACYGPDGQVRLFFTERQPGRDAQGGFREIQRSAHPDRDLIAPTAVHTVLSDPSPGAGADLRDPKVWYDRSSGQFRMILGTAIDGDPCVVLYGSPDGSSWRYLGVLFRAPPQLREQGARCVECPDLFELDGRWVLTLCMEGHADPDTGRRNPQLAVVGSFAGDSFEPGLAGIQELDFGGDMYAMQTFAGSGRRIAMAWMANWPARSPPAGARHSGEMTLPRELSLAGDGTLRMYPTPEYFAAFGRDECSLPCGQTFDPQGQPFEIQIGGDLHGLRLAAHEQGRRSFAFEANSSGLVLATGPESDLRMCRAPCAQLRNLLLIFDRGAIELFANDGAICATLRSCANTNPDSAAWFAPASGIAARAVRLHP